MKKFKSVCLTLCLFICLCKSMSLHLAIRTTHDLSINEQKQAYYNAMIDYQKNLLEESKKAKLGIQDVENNITTVAPQENLEQGIYDQGIDNLRVYYQKQKSALASLYKLKTWECKNLTQEEIDRVNGEIQVLETKANNLTNQQNQGCVRDQEIKWDISNVKLSIQNLKSQISNTCNPPKVIYFLPNLSNGSKFIYGNQTQQNYEKKVNDLKSSGNLVSPCPEQLPFVIDGKCQNCSFYNIGEGKCQKNQCGELDYYNQTSHQCYKKTIFSNIEAANNYIYGNTTKQQYEKQIGNLTNSTSISCPKDKPFLSANNSCINCSENQVFDLSKKACVQCSNATSFNVTTHACIPLPISVLHPQCKEDNMIWNGTGCIKCEKPGILKNNICECPSNYFYSWPLLQCRPNIELCGNNLFWNGTMCIQCPFPGSFNYTEQKCNCPDKYTYSGEIQSCIFGNGSFVRVPNIANSTNWVYGSNGKKGYEKYINSINSETATIQCPFGTPFPNKDGQCVTCGVGELYDFTTKKCTACPLNTVFNQTSHRCIPTTSPETSKLGSLNNCSSNQHWNGTGCVKCQSPGQFKNNTCVCPKSYHYNWTESKCIEKPILYVANFGNQNWVYGSLNQEKYRLQLQNKQEIYKLEKCPESKPFPSTSQECVACPSGKIYDLSTQFCTQCDGSKVFNSTTHQCLQKKVTTAVCPTELPYYNGSACIKCQSPGVWIKENKTCQCPSNQFYNSSSELCEIISVLIKNSNNNALNYQGQRPTYSGLLGNCPQNSPFFNGAECVKCEIPSYFNFKTNKCENCTQPLVFDISSKTCIDQNSKIIKFNSLLTSSDAQNYCCNPPKQDPKLKDCPKDKPFFNKTECVACKSPSYFNFKQFKCEQCKSGQIFDSVTKKCVSAISNSNFQYVSFQGDNVKNYLGSPDTASSGTQARSCSQQFPYYNGKKCIQCKSPQYFDFTKKECLSCPDNKQFDIYKKQCVVKPKKIYNNYLTGNQNYAGTVPKYQQIYETCPQATPYFNGQKCIECKLPKYFNMTSLTCSECSGNNTYFNIVTNLCESRSVKFITDIKHSNIFYNGNFQEVISHYQLMKKGNPNLKDCPSDTPFYVHTEQKCISCPSQKPLFSMNSNQCINCRNDSHFNQKDHTCRSNEIAPTVERMFMNIIGNI